jgi:hypothetical protein
MSVDRAFEPEQHQQGDHQRNCGHPGSHSEQAGLRIRVEQMAGDARGDRKSGDHHEPHQGGGTRAPPRGHPLGEQDQNRSAARTHSDTDHEKRQHR